MPLELREYQQDMIHRTREALRRSRSVLLQAPCGAGKTALTAHMIGNAQRGGYRSWFVCHRRELLAQASRAFDMEGIDYGLCAAGFRTNISKPVQICSIQTLAKRVDRYSEPHLIVFDECHHLGAKTWRELYAKFPRSRIVGLSATPMRLDGQGLSEFFGEMVCGPSPRQLIQGGYLSPVRLFSVNDFDDSGIRIRMGDYALNEAETAMDKPKITGSAVAHYQKHAAGKRAVAFCVSIKHSQHVAAEFQAAGIPALHLDGCADSVVRDGVLRDFAAGKICVLCSVDLLIEGFDLPSIDAAILLRPTHSLNIYIQSTGRAMRASPGKTECLIFDHVGNHQRFGPPDMERMWSLDGRDICRRNAGEREAGIRICAQCFAATKSPALRCANCGLPFPVEGRQVKQVDGELVEVKPLSPEELQERREMLNRKREQGMSGSLEALIRLGTMRGYRSPEKWASHVWTSRQRKRA